MTKLYRIADWDRVHENHDSRKLKRLQWIAIPTNHDTFGYLSLMRLPNGTALYGAYHQILAVAAKCSPRGTLVRGNGHPHTAATIAVSVGGDAALIQNCLDVLQTTEIGWIEAIDVSNTPTVSGMGDRPESSGTISISPGNSPETPGSSPETPGTTRAQCMSVLSFLSSKEKHQDNFAIGGAAERMYALHPKKRNQPLVVVALQSKAVREDDVSAFLASVEACHCAWAQTEDWNKQNGRYAPKLDEWIGDGGYTKWPDGKRPPGSSERPVLDESKVVPYDPFGLRKSKEAVSA